MLLEVCDVMQTCVHVRQRNTRNMVSHNRAIVIGDRQAAVLCRHDAARR